mgnify:CR=1 FL=1
MKVKKLLGSDSSRKVRFQILGKPQMFKNMFLENIMPGDTKLRFFQVFFFDKIQFETERQSGVFGSILEGSAFFFR